MFFFFNDTATTEIYTLSLHDALPIFAAESHQKAARAGKNGVFDEAMTPVLIPQRKGDPIEFREDEGVRPDTTVETLARLKPAFAPDGTITAGTASQKIGRASCRERV